jgi:hypothetical protein
MDGEQPRFDGHPLAAAGGKRQASSVAGGRSERAHSRIGKQSLQPSCRAQCREIGIAGPGECRPVGEQQLLVAVDEDSDRHPVE